MKKLSLFFYLCFCILTAQAQNNIQGQITSTNTNWTTALQNLNTAQITSGILYNKVTPFANLVSFNRPDYNTADYELFNQSISELYRASGQTRFMSSNSLKALVASTTAANTANIGVLNTSFQLLNYNENTPSNGGLTYQNGVFTTIPNKPSFLTKKLLLCSPLKKYISGVNAVFKFSSNLIFTNANSAIKQLVANFGNGTVVTVINNGVIILPSITVNYTSEGYKTITFTAKFNDNSTSTTYGKIYFAYKPTTQALVNEQLPCYESLKDKGVYNTAVQNGLSLPPSTFAYKGYEENSPVNGKIEYTIFYHNNNGNTQKKIIKPIIIIDGFDPGDKRKVLDCDCENDVDCKTSKNHIDENGVYNPLLHTSIEDMMYYEDINPITNLAEEKNLIPILRGLGYDVIIINNPTYTTTNQAGQAVTIDGGADYIERNGMNMVSYIQNVKNILLANGSTEKLVIVGPSMGGQISRYALAYMDKKFAETNNPFWKHNTRLWISVDSPHLGANIPLATQANVYCLGYIAGDEEAKSKYNNLLNSVAARQQIIHQFNSWENATPYQSLFNTYYTNLNSNGVSGSNGYPLSNSTFRKIAMINGSLDGTKINDGLTTAYEKQKYMDIRGYIDLSWWFFNWSITMFKNEDKFMPKYQESETIYKYYQLFNPNSFTVDNAWNFSVTNNDIHGSMDVIPGGKFSSQIDLRDPILKSLSKNHIRSQEGNFFAYHSFIPSFSALGHLQPNQNWGNPLNFNLKCPSNNLTPFDSYFGESKNTTHTTFNKESVAWLLKELAGNPQAPYFPLQTGLLTGPDVVCDTNVTYSFADVCKVPSPVTTWSVSSNLNIVSSTPYSVIVNKIEDGEGFIKATFQNGQTTTKTIWAGKPNPNYELTREEYCNFNYRAKEYYNNNSNATFSWQYVSGTGGASSNNFYTFGDFAHFTACPPFTITLKLIATNSCGTTERLVDFWLNNGEEINRINPNNTNVNSNDIKTYTIYPNPSNDIVTVDLRNQNNLPEKGATISGELFDMMGQSKAKIQIIQNKASFSVRGLNKGIYVLKIYINHQVETHQIAVQ